MVLEYLEKIEFKRLKKKFERLKKEYPDLELHLTGPLQTNKTKDAIKSF